MAYRTPVVTRPVTFRVAVGTLFLSSAIASVIAKVAYADDGHSVHKLAPVHESELIFPHLQLHTHGSCLVECANGDLLTCWYQGSGERRADDVAVFGSRRRGDKQWSKPFLMADAPGFPDTNPCLVVDPRGKLWLIWQTIIANEWHTALTRFKIATNYLADGAPEWETSEALILKPGPEFAETVGRQCDADEKSLDKLPEAQRERARAYLARRREHAADKYFIRMGWMTRVHPLVLDGKRMVVPLYSDGFDFSIMAISDDWGATWTASQPLVSHGGVQPSVARKKDGTLVALMRDNGPPPKRVLRSESQDRGQTWTPVVDTEIANPGAGLEVISLSSGNWLLINNDTEQGRHRLTVSLSDDEGDSWKWSRALEFDEPGPEATTASYPSVIQSRDGTLHVTYTYTLKGKNVTAGLTGKQEIECTKHVKFNELFVKQSSK